MTNILNKLDERAFVFLFVFLNIILAGALFLISYGVYYNYISEHTPLLIFQNAKMTLEYLWTSLCECILGAFLLDYIFSKKEQ